MTVSLDRVVLTWLSAPQMVTPERISQIARSWQEVSNAGGAVGFPFPPVELDEVLARTKQMVSSLDPLLKRLLIATIDDDLAGWLVLSGNNAPLTSHWATVERVQTDLAFRGTGVGREIMEEVSRAAAEDLRLKSLHIEVRGGAGLEGFYESLGWIEVGRWPGSLRFGGDDYRDIVLMYLWLDSFTQHPRA
jgi:GNAT superfamily N-acetyltransferase